MAGKVRWRRAQDRGGSEEGSRVFPLFLCASSWSGIGGLHMSLWVNSSSTHAGLTGTHLLLDPVSRASG